jgi:hypothetical protein
MNFRPLSFCRAEAMTTFQRQLENREQVLEGAADIAVMVVHKLTIKSAGPLARQWLVRYFPGREGNRSDDQLPEPIARWLRFRQTTLNRKHSEVGPGGPLTIQSPDGQLSIRLIETQGEESMLLLSHERGGDHPELLERLGLMRREADETYDTDDSLSGYQYNIYNYVCAPIYGEIDIQGSRDNEVIAFFGGNCEAAQSSPSAPKSSGLNEGVCFLATSKIFASGLAQLPSPTPP